MSAAPTFNPSRRALFVGATASIVASMAPCVVGAAAPPAGYIKVLGAGQSLISRWSWAGNPAFPALQSRLALAGETRQASFMNVAQGGSSLLKAFVNPGLMNWWDETTDQPGPALQNALWAINAASVKPNCIVWDQGQTECYTVSQMDDATFTTLYRQAGYKVFSMLRGVIGFQAPIFIERIGPIHGDMAYFPRQQIIRDIQAVWVGTKWSNIFWGAIPDDRLPLLDDGYHPTDEGFAELGAMTADMMRGRI